MKAARTSAIPADDLRRQQLLTINPFDGGRNIDLVLPNGHDSFQVLPIVITVLAKKQFAIGQPVCTVACSQLIGEVGDDLPPGIEPIVKLELASPRRQPASLAEA